jgi:flagellar biosynthesis/type III secretory pathway chaperone
LFDDLGTIETVTDIADGVIFHKIMNAVDPNTYGMTRVNRTVGGDISLRLHNLQLAVNGVVHFYLTSQQQLILSSLPDIVTIAHKPTSEKSLDELERFMILLLGCAIQSDNKEQLIEQMKNMQVERQQALIFYIQKITETTEFVCSLDWNDLCDIAKTDLEALCRTAYVHMQRVAKERDTLFDTLIDIVQERDFYKKEQQAMNDESVYKASPSPQINAEVIELKKQVRIFQEDNDHKSDAIAELSQQLEQAKAALQKLHAEVMTISLHHYQSILMV